MITREEKRRRRIEKHLRQRAERERRRALLDYSDIVADFEVGFPGCVDATPLPTDVVVGEVRLLDTGAIIGSVVVADSGNHLHCKYQCPGCGRRSVGEYPIDIIECDSGRKEYRVLCGLTTIPPEPVLRHFLIESAMAHLPAQPTSNIEARMIQ